MWPAVVGGGATGAGRGQKFSKMQIIKWQPIKYANELCGVARTHSHTHTERDATDAGNGYEGDRQRRSMHHR